MHRDMMSGNEAAAWAVRLAKPDFIPVYPITPQTEIIETLAQWYANGELDSSYLPMDSEHSVLSAAVGASAAGGRVFTATSSQGLLLMHEILYVAAGMRLPIVMANVSRGLSAPITLWSDHNDFLGVRDCGWLMFHAQNNQEVFDSLLMAYMISENKDVLLPSIVNMDGYVLSYTHEPTTIRNQKDIDKLLGKYEPKHAYFRPDDPMCQGAPAIDGEKYTFFKKQMHKAQLNALDVIEKTCRVWNKNFETNYGLVDNFETEDAEIILVTQGSISTTAKAEIVELRKQGHKVGLLRLRTIRPWPRKQIFNVLKNAQAVAVIDKNIAPGLGGIMYPEIKEALFDSKILTSNFILGLGGKPESKDQFKQIYEKMKQDLQHKKENVWFV